MSELERQVGPLERQSEKAKIYLNKKSELKELDVNMFLLEMERIEREKKELTEKHRIANDEMEETNAAYDRIKAEYEALQEAMKDMDDRIDSIRENISQSSVTKEKLESQIQVLNEQIHTAEMTDEHLQNRLLAIENDKNERLASKQSYEEKKAVLDEQYAAIEERKAAAQSNLEAIQAKIAECNTGIENGQAELIDILNNNASIKARQQRFDTMLEQINIRKAELSKRLLDRKTEEADLHAVLEGYEADFAKVNAQLTSIRAQEADLLEKVRSWKEKDRENTRKMEEAQMNFHKQQSRLESLKNIAERYDGYGNSIRKVMEQKSENPGLLGVVSDLIQVDKKYEVAIETALGGNIQNIVTEDEMTAKKMIDFLKANRLGRATFLPLTSVSAKGNSKNEAAMGEKGVIGIANQLVHCEEKYKEVAAYLLGRVLVVDTVDNALTIARKHHYSLHIVTLEGEYLSPGGSMTGGAFKNSSNLLARNREIEELEKTIADITRELASMKARKEDIATALALNEEELVAVKAQIEEQVIAQTAAQMNVERARQQKNDSENAFASLMNENEQMELQIVQINTDKQKIFEEDAYAKRRKAEIEEESKNFQAVLEEQAKLEESAQQLVSNIAMEAATQGAQIQFVLENLFRIHGEIEKYDAEREELSANASQAKADVEKKLHDIEEIRLTIAASVDASSDLQEKLNESIAKKEEMSETYRGFFQKQEDISKRKNNLDREIIRLSNALEKLTEAEEFQTNYMWEEYEITPHAATELRKEIYDNLAELKKMIAEIKDEIRKLGDVNVNAIEEYKEVSARYEFLKGQHDDLVEAEQTLIGIIEELDQGMRKQFEEKFGEIQKEFDVTFKQLFGGGHGTLELVEDEDILECGIRIIAQPPGKKLQNMMQLSGGEKALTAIALLFAIQSLKPSPFCLLDEIEAALDDSNVGRFANYLNKLTQNTQYIIITHRRGTMAAADRLYGITMQEKGVSALVSVNLIENDLSE